MAPVIAHHQKTGVTVIHVPKQIRLDCAHAGGLAMFSCTNDSIEIIVLTRLIIITFRFLSTHARDSSNHEPAFSQNEADIDMEVM